MTTTSPAPLFAFPPATEGAPRLSVVVPMYNEAGNAAALVTEIAEAVASFDAEIIVVDDNIGISITDKISPNQEV